MVNEISLKKARDLRGKSMSVGMRFMQERVTAEKLADNYNALNSAKSQTNQDNDKTRNS